MKMIEPCPSNEDLSSWIDGESSHDYSVHCQSCSSCQKIVDEFRSIDGATVQFLKRIDIDKEIETKIIKDLNHRPTPIHFIWIRHAIKTAIVILVAFLIHKFSQEPSESLIAKTATSNAPNETTPRSEPSLKSTETLIKNTETPISPKYVMNGNDPLQKMYLLNINYKVEHTWQAKDLELAIETIVAHTPKDFFMSFTRDNHEANIVLDLSEANYKFLVSQMQKSGHKLIFPIGDELAPVTFANPETTFVYFIKIVTTIP